MTQNCIDYQQYKRILQQQSQQPTPNPPRNLFEQNRTLKSSIEQLTAQNSKLAHQMQYLRNVCASIIEAIGRVFSGELARELEGILNRGYCAEDQDVSAGDVLVDTIYQVLATHQSHSKSQSCLYSHSQVTVSDWSQSRHRSLRTPQKLNQSGIRNINRQILTYRQQSFQNESISPRLSLHNQSSRISFRRKQPQKSRSISPVSISNSNQNNNIQNYNSVKENDPSTNRSSNHNIILNGNYIPTQGIIATGINCQICYQTFAPNQFIEHASRCKSSDCSFSDNGSILSQNISMHSQQISQSSLQSSSSSCSFSNPSLTSSQSPDHTLQDTQDRKLRTQSQAYLKMMENLIMIQNQIEQQLQLIKVSKEKIDRDAEKRKLEKDLAKVMMVIEEKKKFGEYQSGQYRDMQRDKERYMIKKQKHKEKEKDKENKDKDRAPKAKKSCSIKVKN